MSLTQLIGLIKKYAPFALLGVIIIFILFYSIKVAIVLYKNKAGENIVLNPVFGPISKPVLKDSTSSAGFKFQIDTIEGKPVTATKSANVYFITPVTTKFSYRDKISMMAKNLGFENSNTYNLQEDTAYFINDTRSFDVKITNFNFIYKYQYEKDPNLFIRSIIPTAQEAENESISLLSSLDRNVEEFDKSKTVAKYFFYNVDKKVIVPVARNIDANIAEVNFFRGGIDNFPTVSSRFPNSSNYVRLASTDREFIPIEAQITFFERAIDKVGAYPLITGDAAFEALKKGEGIVLLNSNPSNKNKIIKKMYLAYLEPEKYTQYLQPVYVFEGDNFAMFVPAIKN